MPKRKSQEHKEIDFKIRGRKLSEIRHYELEFLTARLRRDLIESLVKQGLNKEAIEAITAALDGALKEPEEKKP